jgi:hypothetical protein
MVIKGSKYSALSNQMPELDLSVRDAFTTILGDTLSFC